MLKICNQFLNYVYYYMNLLTSSIELTYNNEFIKID
jgi:hypothetical protein